MTDTFSWVPTSTSRATSTGLVRRAQFGDGYAQSIADGINPMSRAYDLTFTGSSALISQIAAFLDAHVGVSFFFAHPIHGTGLYYCDSYSDSGEGLTYTLTATFQQTFQP